MPDITTLKVTKIMLYIQGITIEAILRNTLIILCRLTFKVVRYDIDIIAIAHANR
jgi:hypothetical protein